MKRKLIIISLILFIFLPINVYALSGTIKITCDKTTLSLNSSTTCHITATTDGEVSSVHSVINVSNGLELTTVNKSDIWEGDSDKVLDLYTADNKNGTFNIADFEIKAIKAGTHKISLTDTTLGDKNFKEYSFTVSPYNLIVSDNSSDESSSSTSSSSSSSTKPSSSNPSSSSSSSSSASSSNKPSSSSSSNQSSSSSNSQSLKKPLYTIELNNHEIYVGKSTELSFSANTSGLLKVTSSNTKIFTASSTKYNLATNETKVFKLNGHKKGTANVIIEFIPNNSDEYQTIKETYKIIVQNVPNPNTNVDVNPPTGSSAVLLVATIGLAILGYIYWYYRTNQQH